MDRIDEPERGAPAELVARYRALAAELAEIGFIARGSVISATTTCSSKGCHCQADPARRHGPYWQWSRSSRRHDPDPPLSEAEAKLYQDWIAERRRAEAILEDSRSSPPRRPRSSSIERRPGAGRGRADDARRGRLFPGQVARDLPGSDRFGQLGGAHAPQLGGRGDGHADLLLPRRRTAPPSNRRRPLQPAPASASDALWRRQSAGRATRADPPSRYALQSRNHPPGG